jgi:hypothetical protein
MIAPSSQRCWHTQYSLSSSSSSSEAGSGVTALGVTGGMVDADRDRDAGAVSDCATFRAAAAAPFLWLRAWAAGAATGGVSLAAFTFADGFDCRFGNSVVLGFAGACDDISS